MDPEMDQSREAHLAAWPLHSPEGAMSRGVAGAPVRVPLRSETGDRGETRSFRGAHQ